eukprot:s1038_g1.t3
MDGGSDDLSALSRELLRCQLDDLDVFLNNARQLQLPTLPPLPPEERQEEVSLPLPPLDSADVLEAQLQNVETFLSEMRSRGAAAARGEPWPPTAKATTGSATTASSLWRAPEAGGAATAPSAPSAGRLWLRDAPKSVPSAVPSAGPSAQRSLAPRHDKLANGDEDWGYVFDLETEWYFRAWSSIAKTMRTAKRQKREENSRRYLGKPARAQTLWALVDGLYGHETLRPLGLHGAGRLLRGQRMRRLFGEGGTFLSCMEKGARCKVLFDGKSEAETVASEELFKVQTGAHPYAAAVAFLVWNLFTVSQNQLRLARLRSELGYHRGWGKIGRALLRMTTFSDPSLALQLTLRRWRSCLVQKEAKRLRLERLQQVFKAWFEVLVMVKYNNAMDQLERTSEKLQTAKTKCLEAETRTEKMKAPFSFFQRERCDAYYSRNLEDQGYTPGEVLFAWQWAVKLSRSTKDFALQARLRRAEQTLKLSDSFGQGTADLKPIFQAWSSLAIWLQPRAQGVANSTDLAFFFLTFDEALQEAGRAVADAWQSARSNSSVGLVVAARQVTAM